jgi:hypothetical protein
MPFDQSERDDIDFLLGVSISLDRQILILYFGDFLRVTCRNANVKDLKELIVEAQITDVGYKKDLAKEFLVSQVNAGNHLAILDVEMLATELGIVNEDDKFELIAAALGNEENPNSKISLAEFVHYLNRARDANISKQSVSLLIFAFFDVGKNEHNLFSAGTFIDALETLKIQDSHLKAQAIKAFLGNRSNSANNNLSLPELITLMERCAVNDEEEKYLILGKFLENRGNDKITKKTLVKILQIVESQNYKIELLKTYFYRFDTQEGHNFYQLTEQQDNDLLIDWREICEIAKSLNFDFSGRKDVVEFIIDNIATIFKSFEQREFFVMLDDFAIDDLDSRADLYGKISKERGYNKNVENIADFCNAVRGLFAVYNINFIISFYLGFVEDIEDEQGEDVQDEDDFYKKASADLLLIANELYRENSLLKTILLQHFFIASDISADKIILFRENFLQLSDDDALELFEFLAQDAGLELAEKDLLLLVKNRISQKYSSFSNLFSRSSEITHWLSPQGLQAVAEIFGQEFLRQENITINDLLSYFNVRGQLHNFHKFLNPTRMARFAHDFAFEDSVAMVSCEDLRKAYQLTSGQENPATEEVLGSRLARQLFPLVLVCDHLKAKAEIPPLQVGEVYELDFANMYLAINESDSEAEAARKAQLRQEVGQLFAKILSNVQRAKSEEIIKFSKIFFNIEADFGGEKAESFCDFFKQNIAAIALIITNSAQRPQNLNSQILIENLLTTLVDGCSKNIANQFQMALCSSLLQDPCDKVWQLFFHQEIAAKTFNAIGAADLIDLQDNPLENQVFLNSCLNPRGLFQNLCIFLQGESALQLRSDIVLANMGAEMGADLLERTAGDERIISGVACFFMLERIYGRDLVVEKLQNFSEFRDSINVLNVVIDEFVANQSPESSASGAAANQVAGAEKERPRVKIFEI